MQKNFTKLIAHFLSSKRYTVPAGAFLLFLATSLYVWAAVGVTVTGGASFPVSADLAADATLTTPGYTAIGDIVITEEFATDVSAGGDIVLNAPAGWRFSTGASASVVLAPGETGGSNTISIGVGTPVTSVDGSQITIPLSYSNNNKREQITISGVQVQALNGGNVPGSGNINISLANGAVVAGLPATVSKALSQVAGAARKLGFTTQPGGAAIYEVLNPQPVVAVQDQFGNTVISVTAASASVTVAIDNNPGSGVLSGTTTVKASNGVATFSDLSIDAGGKGYTLTASSGGLSLATSSVFSINSTQPTLAPIAETVCITVGAPAQEITLTGSNFARNAVARVGGSNRTTTFISSTELRMTLLEADLAAAGSKLISVVNPGPTNSVSKTQTLVVHNIFENITINGDRDVCTGEIQSYWGLGSFTDYEWSVTEGASFVLQSDIGYRIIFDEEAPASGKVTITVSAKNACGVVGTQSFDVIVTQSPPAELTAPNGTTACAGNTVALEATPVEGATYKWLFNGTAVTDYITDNTYSAGVSGKYQVMVKSSSSGCTATSSIVAVTLYEFPTATIAEGATATYCAGGSTTLTAQESGTGYTYQWYVGGSPIDNETARTLEVSTEGAYTVEVFRNGCSTMSDPTTVTELPLPTAEITPASATEFCAGGSVTLNATTGTGYTYKWYAEGNNTVLDSDASFTTSTPGNYYVEVTGSNGCKATSASVAVLVNQPPVATIEVTGPAEFCAGESVFLNAPAAPFGSTYAYEWYLNGGTTVIGTNQSIEASESGTYTVKVTNTATGCESTSAGTVVKEGTLEFAIFTYTGATEFCEGGTLQLDAILPPADQTYEYRWFNSEGTTVATTRSYTVTTTGAYQVEITETSIENDCVKISDPLQVTVNPQPTASIDGASQSLCAEADNTTSFSVSGTFSGGTAVWSSSNTNFVIQDAVYNTTTGVATATVVATGSGDATISLTTSSTVEGCREAADAVVLNVKPLPIATITPRGETTFCQGGEVILDASQGAGYTYQWYMNGEPVIGTGSSYTASLSGNYYVIVTSNGCPVQSPAVEVTVNPQPTATIEAEGDLVFCEGGSVTLNAVSDIGTNFTWFNGPTQVGTGQTFVANESGSYSVLVEAGTGCTNTSAAVEVTVNPTPDATITATGPTTFCQGGSVILSAPSAPTGQTYTYQWFNGDTQISVNGTSQTYQAYESGNYTVRVTNTSTALNCSATTANPVAVTVNPLPTASISYTGSTTLCQGSSLLLTGTSDTGTSYIWYRDNVQVATSPTYSATTTGSYTVRATDGNTCTSDMSAAVQVTVNPSITGNAIASNQTVCSGGTIAALGQASGTSLSGGATPYEYQWQTSTDNSTWSNITTGGTAASYTPPVQTVTTATTFYYRRIVSGGGCSNTSNPVSVTVNPLTPVSISGVTDGATYHTGQNSVALAGSPTGGTFTGKGVSGSVNAGFTFSPCTAGVGTHTITYTYKSSAGCTSTAQATVNVVQSTYRAVITANPHPFCRGGGGTEYTAAVYRDVQPGEIIYPYLVDANGNPVDAAGNAIPKGSGNYPVPNPDYPYPAGTPESIKAMSFRFFQPIVSAALAARQIAPGSFNYQWGKNDAVDRKNDDWITSDAGLSSQDYYEVEVKSSSLCSTVALESNRMYSAVLESYTVALSAAPNPICQGAAVTFTATLGAAFPWNVANLKLDFVLERGNVVLNPTSFTYTGSNTITFTTDAAAAGGFVNGDKVSARFSSNIESYLPSSNCIEGPASKPVTIQVNDIIASTPTDQSTTICFNGSATFTAPVTTTGPATVTYTWTVGTKTYTTSSASLKVPAEVTGTAGSYPVSVVVSNSCETTSTLALGTLTVKPALALFTVSGGGSYCAGSPVSYPMMLSGSQTGVSYTLVRGTTTVQTLAGTGSPLNFTATSTPGTYTVRAVYATAPACEVTMTGSAAIIQNPLPTVTVTSPTVCQGEAATVTATPANGTGPYSYTWTNLPAGVANPGNVASFQTTVPGTYTVSVMDSKSCASSETATSTVTVNPRPTVTVNSPTVCAGTAATLTAVPSGGSGTYTTYTWTVPDGVTNPGNVASFQSTVAGTYIVSVMDSKSCASSAAATGTVTVNPVTEVTDPTLEVVWNTAGTAWTVTALEEDPEGAFNYDFGDSPRRFTWYRRESTSPDVSGDGWVVVATGESNVLTVENIGTDTQIKVEVFNTATCTQYILHNIGVTPLPVEIIYLNAVKQGNNVVLEWATAMEEDNTGFEVQVSTDGFNYRLLTFVPAKNGNSSTKQEYVFTDKENGKSGTRYYRLKQIDTNGTYEFFGPKAVTFGSVASKVIAFPNPFHDEVTLDIAAEVDGEALITVTDAVGKQLLERKVQVQKGFTTEKLRLDANLPRGLYIIKVQVGGITQYIKMIKE